MVFQNPNCPLLKKKTPKEDTPTIKEIDNKILRNKQLQNFKNKVSQYFDNLSSSEDAQFLSASEILENFENHIYEAAFEVAASETRKQPDWFTESKETLIEAIQARNNAFECFIKHPSESS